MHAIKIIAWSLVAAAGVVGTLVVQPVPAQARSAGAFIGQARYGSDAGCFYEAAGGPRQQYCDASIDWVIPIVYDASGWATIRVTARGASTGANNVSCRAYSLTESGNYLEVGSESHTVRNDGATEYLTPSVNAPAFGGAWATCTMDRYTRLFSVHH